MTDDDMKKIIEKMANNPKIKKAMKGLLAPLRKEGDSLTIIKGTQLSKPMEEEK